MTQFDVVVIGGGISGLTAAWRAALAGRSVAVLEAGDALGGPVAGHVLAGLELDAGTESFATRGGALEPVLNQLGFFADGDHPAIVAPDPVGACVGFEVDGEFKVAPLPSTGLLGIPGDFAADGLADTLGAAGLAEAKRDLTRPIDDVDGIDDLASLVRVRMGQRVLDRLVAPVVGGVYSADPSTVRIDAVAPQLRAAIRSTGSLSAAVAHLRRLAPPGSPVRGLVGGMHTLTDELVRRLRAAGVELRLQAAVRTIAPADSGAPAVSDTQMDSGWRLEVGTETVTAQQIVVATPAADALQLLGQLDPALLEFEWPAPAHVELVTVVADGAALDDLPVGTGILLAPGTAAVEAKAMTHVTAKWRWARDAATAEHPHRHVLRLSYGRAGDAVAESAERLSAQAVRDAKKITGVDFDPVAVDAVGWDNAQFGADRAVALERLRGLAMVTGICVVGSWVSGIGLASVIPHAVRTVDAVLASSESGR